MDSVALVGRAGKEPINIEFIVDKTDRQNATIFEDVGKELSFYLLELRKEDPWQYLKYHCTTASNVVHWSFIKPSADPAESQPAKIQVPLS